MAKNDEDLEKTDKIEKIEKTEKRTIKVKPKKSENKSTEKEDNTTILAEPDTEIADENEELPIPSTGKEKQKPQPQEIKERG